MSRSRLESSPDPALPLDIDDDPQARRAALIERARRGTLPKRTLVIPMSGNAVFITSDVNATLRRSLERIEADADPALADAFQHVLEKVLVALLDAPAYIPPAPPRRRPAKPRPVKTQPVRPAVSPSPKT